MELKNKEEDSIKDESHISGLRNGKIEKQWPGLRMAREGKENKFNSVEVFCCCSNQWRSALESI